jgi:phage terminase large subunit-like protein
LDLREDVYDIAVEGASEFFANGILVHNCDEIAAWRYPDAWTQAKFGLRLGKSPQAVITTTPRPTKIIIELSKDKNTLEVVGSSYENRANISDKYYSIVIAPYEGTRLGRQEIGAEILLDRPNALFKRDSIDAQRIKIEELPPLARIVVAIDPAVTSNANSAETGIVVVGKDHRSPAHFYVLDDASDVFTPNEWGNAAVAAYKNRQADRIIGEVNQGGDLVEANIRNVDPSVPYKAVRASRGKARRAEPISGLYEQSRVHHVGALPKLEDQMCDFDPQEENPNPSPDRMDALVWGLAELSEMRGFTEPVVEIITPRRKEEERGWVRVG